jgi:transposase
MKATSSTQHSFVISLLQEGYSVRQIQSKTGLGKSTVGRIKKEMDEDKENMMGGRPAHFSSGQESYHSPNHYWPIG